MRQTTCYMVPKLVCLNLLALMMFSLEHSTTANDQPLLKTARVKQPVPAEKAGLIQASATRPAAEVSPVIAVARPMHEKNTVLAKKPVPHHARLKTPFMLIKAKHSANTPLDCCFRGNRS